MEKKWKKLSNPPVVTAIFQILFEDDKLKLEDFLSCDTRLRRDLPNKSENLESSLSLSPATRIPLGKAKVSGEANTRRVGYVYFTTDQKDKLSLSEHDITYTTESDYLGWDSFKNFVLKILGELSDVLRNAKIKRTSIRFINQFKIENFDDPTEYFNTQIVSSIDEAMQYPLLKYGFRLTFDVSEGIYSIVNQNADRMTDKYVYIFDIDVLDNNNMMFDVKSIDEKMENLRNIKNTIFFANLTQKTLKLCD